MIGKDVFRSYFLLWRLFSMGRKNLFSIYYCSYRNWLLNCIPNGCFTDARTAITCVSIFWGLSLNCLLIPCHVLFIMFLWQKKKFLCENFRLVEFISHVKSVESEHRDIEKETCKFKPMADNLVNAHISSNIISSL